MVSAMRNKMAPTLKYLGKLAIIGLVKEVTP